MAFIIETLCSGSVYTCGLNDAHQLGLGSTPSTAPPSALLPKHVSILPSLYYLPCTPFPVLTSSLPCTTFPVLPSLYSLPCSPFPVLTSSLPCTTFPVLPSLCSPHPFPVLPSLYSLPCSPFPVLPSLFSLPCAHLIPSLYSLPCTHVGQGTQGKGCDMRGCRALPYCTSHVH